jgi:uncharacterized RDD family membrane protein YckC
MFCQNCGAQLPGNATFCTACGTAVPGAGIPVGEGPVPAPPAGERAPAPAAPEAAPAAYRPPAAPAPVRFAGFWLRLVAFLIDWVALQIISLVMVPVLTSLGLPLDPFEGEQPSLGELMNRPDLLELFFPAMLMSVAVGWLYFALLESSAWQATLGKKALGLAVTDLDGRRVSFLRATGRHFAKFLSWFTLAIGFILAGLTAKKQALHDIISDCLVIRRRR